MTLLDTNILIDYFRGKTSVIEFLSKLEKSNFGISDIVSIELFNGCLNKAEFIVLRKELNGFLSFEINESIGKTALYLSQKYALSHKMSVADTLIAATALVYNLELYTYNLKDFSFIPNLKVTNPFK